MDRSIWKTTSTIALGILIGLGITSLLRLPGNATTGSGITSVSYAFVYESFTEAYEEADLVVTGEVARIEYYLRPDSDEEIETTFGTIVPSTPFTISLLEIDVLVKGELSQDTIYIIQCGGKGYHDIPVLIPEDPPFIVGEKVLLFLHKNRYTVRYEADEYVYYGPFGRFEILDDRVFSVMHGLPENMLGKSTSKLCAKAILESTDYSLIDGVPIETFIQILGSKES